MSLLVYLCTFTSWFVSRSLQHPRVISLEKGGTKVGRREDKEISRFYTRDRLSPPPDPPPATLSGPTVGIEG